MKAGDKDIVVRALRVALSQRLGRDRFETWFGADVDLRIADGRLRVAAGNQFRLDRLKQFRGELAAALAEVAEGDLPLQFLVDPACGQGAAAEPVARGSGRPRVADSSARRDDRPVETFPSGPRPRRQLADFVGGSFARFALEAIASVVERPGAVTPLLLHGPTGCGKSHLMEGIAEAVRRGNRVRRLLSMTAESFTSQFLEALKGGGMPVFRSKFRGVDMLLVDDVQFFSGKRSTVGELQVTVDTLLRDQKQVVFTADRPLAELSELGAQLLARLTGGLTCRLELPDFAARREILQRMAAQRGMQLPAEVVELIAGQLDGDPRQLSGALHRLWASNRAEGVPIDRQMAEAALADGFGHSPRIVRLREVEDVVCDLFGIDSRSLHSQRKTKTVSQPRMLAMWLARKATRAPYSEIGSHFGGRSHSTVISAEKKVQQWLATGETIQMGRSECRVAEAVRRLEVRLRTG